MDYANKHDVEQLLFKTDLSNYRISKETGIGEATLNKYKRGESDIENMTFGNAIKLQNYFSKLKEENKLTSKISREEAFGRSFAILNVVGARRFDKGSIGIEAQFMQDFNNKPMTVYYRAYKRVMEYAELFDKTDTMLMDRINHYIGLMDPDDYNDNQLDPKFLIYFSNESLKLEKYTEKGEDIK